MYTKDHALFCVVVPVVAFRKGERKRVVVREVKDGGLREEAVSRPPSREVRSR